MKMNKNESLEILREMVEEISILYLQVDKSNEVIFKYKMIIEEEKEKINDYGKELNAKYNKMYDIIDKM